jgi:hypothetical protein
MENREKMLNDPSETDRLVLVNLIVLRARAAMPKGISLLPGRVPGFFLCTSPSVHL